ncbi:hypothetical protein KP509_10G017400 [Ceratopteris richardii]|uniref:Uncharacterized protein n=1 Tax=Ceratopteris richardii TaxID=49495 RepID=A0A8T2TZ10_CERRI|nr:hypothetical protein KP509_10G017400 [Ceratopteris richardii]
MAGRQFMHRVMQYVANELIVDRLANSHSFQRFAVRSSRAIEEASRKSAKATQQVKENLEDFLDYLKTEHFRGPTGNKR